LRYYYSTFGLIDFELTNLGLLVSYPLKSLRIVIVTSLGLVGHKMTNIV